MAYGFTVFEGDECWYRKNAVLCGEILVLIDVDFNEFDFIFIGVGSCEVVDDGSGHFAWSAPFCVEINEYDSFVLEYFFIELILIYVCNCHRKINYSRIFWEGRGRFVKKYAPHPPKRTGAWTA